VKGGSERSTYSTPRGEPPEASRGEHRRVSERPCSDCSSAARARSRGTSTEGAPTTAAVNNPLMPPRSAAAESAFIACSVCSARRRSTMASLEAPSSEAPAEYSAASGPT